MVKQYPNTIVATIITGGTFVNGDPVAGTESTIESACRLQTSDGNGKLAGVDGSFVDYSWIVHLPLNDIVFNIGSKVQVKNEAGEVVCSDTVKHFSKGQLHSRIWL